MTTHACSNSLRSSASSFPTEWTATFRFATNCAAATSIGSKVNAVKCPNCQNDSCNQSILGPSIAASGGPVRPGDFLSIFLSIGRQGVRRMGNGRLWPKVAGHSGDTELTAQRCHLLTFEEPGYETKSLIHRFTLFPRHPGSHPNASMCKPCVRNIL
jgi:hypothetical protein